MSQNIGIIGGSFDPIHNGHLIIALDALEQFDLDEVIFIPAFQAPLRSKGPAASPADRMRMVELAIEGEKRFRVSDVDFRSTTTSYSIRTARLLKEELPQAELHWILGSDQVNQLRQWRSIEELSQLVRFIAFDRPGSQIESAAPPTNDTQILRGRHRALEISSTEIRERLESGRSVKYFLPAPVFDYIKARNLY